MKPRRSRSPTPCPSGWRPTSIREISTAPGRFAERLETGAVGINVNDTTELQAPFGGWKLSGLGRELGVEGLMAFREPKHIKMRLRSGGNH